jgi:hypothetical protein
VNYFSNGALSYPKEQLQVFNGDRVLSLENFRRTRGYGFSGFRSYRTVRQEKGHAAELSAFVDRITRGGDPLVPVGELINSTLASFAAVTAVRENRVVVLGSEYGLPSAGAKSGGCCGNQDLLRDFSKRNANRN